MHPSNLHPWWKNVYPVAWTHGAILCWHTLTKIKPVKVKSLTLSEKNKLPHNFISKHYASTQAIENVYSTFFKNRNNSLSLIGVVTNYLTLVMALLGETFNIKFHLDFSVVLCLHKTLQIYLRKTTGKSKSLQFKTVMGKLTIFPRNVYSLWTLQLAVVEHTSYNISTSALEFHFLYSGNK